MGYDVHITRAEDWIESKRVPISEAEWLSVVQADSSLRIDTANYLEMRDLETGALRRIHPVLWDGHAEQPPPFWFVHGRIETKNPDDATVSKMVALAARLGARVVGDDGELYE